MMKMILVITVTIILSGILWYEIFNRKEKRLLSSLQSMIEAAGDGTFERQHISETQLSAVENSLKRYLDDSMIVSENQQKQKELIQGLISDISHQTLTPVSNLKIYAQLIEEETKGQSEAVNTIVEQTEKLDFLIQSLVKLSRLESGIIEVQPQKNEMSRLLKTLQLEYSAKAQEKNIALTCDDSDMTASYDWKWTVEAVGNIVDNAIKYTPEGGAVHVSVQSYSFFARIDVTDTGIGIEEQEIPKIFTRFYRSFAVADRPGVGIGLYLAREIIGAQRGYIKVNSVPGEGSTFSIFLPL